MPLQSCSARDLCCGGTTKYAIVKEDSWSLRKVHGYLANLYLANDREPLALRISIQYLRQTHQMGHHTRHTSTVIARYSEDYLQHEWNTGKAFNLLTHPGP